MRNYDVVGFLMRRVLQTCSLTWEMGSNFLNDSGRGKERKKSGME